VLTDTRIHLTKDRKSFVVGTHQQASDEGWASWPQLLQELGSDHQLAEYLYSLTSFTRQEMLQVAGKAQEFWPPFEQKITNFNTILAVNEVFEKYSEHVLRKYIANGYDRIEFRALLTPLKHYDEAGNYLGELPDSSFANTFETAYERVRKDHPGLSVGFIFFGLRCLSDH